MPALSVNSSTSVTWSTKPAAVNAEPHVSELLLYLKSLGLSDAVPFQTAYTSSQSSPIAPIFALPSPCETDAVISALPGSTK